MGPGPAVQHFVPQCIRGDIGELVNPKQTLLLTDFKRFDLRRELTSQVIGYREGEVILHNLPALVAPDENPCAS